MLERTREFGLFQALGMPPHQVLGQVLAESLILLALALVLGNAAAWATIAALAGGISRPTVREMVEAVARVTGYQDEIRYVPVAEAVKAMDDFAECLVLDQHVDGRKAERVLGWRPRHNGFVEDIEVYFEAWKAAQSAV